MMYNDVFPSSSQECREQEPAFVDNTVVSVASLVAQTTKNPPAMWDTWVRSLGWDDPLEKGMATHCSILAWRIQWAEEPGRLQSMRSQSQRQLSDFHFLFLWFQRVSQVALVGKNPPANAGDIRDVGLIPGSGRSSGEGNGNPLQYSCLENLMDREAWQATVHRVAKSDTIEAI